MIKYENILWLSVGFGLTLMAVFGGVALSNAHIWHWQARPDGEGAPAECEGLSGSARARCYIGVAERRGEPGLCENVDQEVEQVCYTRVAVAEGEERICRSAPEPGLCVKDLAMAVTDVSLCGFIGDRQVANDCYTALLRKTGDLDICGYFVGEGVVKPPECTVSGGGLFGF